jgi:hypothetical protein
MDFFVNIHVFRVWDKTMGGNDDDFGFTFMYWLSYFLLDAFYGIRTKLLVTHTKMSAIWLAIFSLRAHPIIAKL